MVANHHCHRWTIFDPDSDGYRSVVRTRRPVPGGYPMSLSTFPNPTGRAAGQPWSVRAAAQFLGVSERSVWRMIDAKEVRVTRLLRRVLGRASEARPRAGEGN